jgi:hypothetical protein
MENLMRSHFRLLLITVSCISCFCIFLAYGDDPIADHAIAKAPILYDDPADAPPVFYDDPADVRPRPVFQDEPNQDPVFEQPGAVANSPSRMQLRLLCSDDVATGAVDPSRRMHVGCSAVEVQANANNGQTNYEFRCAGPIELRRGQTSVSGSSAEYSNGSLLIHDAKILVGADDLRMEAKELRIDYHVTQFSMSDNTLRQPETPVTTYSSY